MTIIVGMVCKGAIVLASDSQTTDGTVKRLDAEKIARVDFKNCSALVAASGFASTSQEAVRKFQKSAEDKEITHDDEIAYLARDAVREVRMEQVGLLGKRERTAEELEDVLRSKCMTELVVAYYFNGTPYFWTTDILMCVPVRPNNRCYVTSGCGANLADYLLKEHFVSDAEPAFGAALSAFIVDKVIDNDAGCGGVIRIECLFGQLDYEPIMCFAMSSSRCERLLGWAAGSIELMKGMLSGSRPNSAASIRKQRDQGPLQYNKASNVLRVRIWR